MRIEMTHAHNYNAELQFQEVIFLAIATDILDSFFFFFARPSSSTVWVGKLSCEHTGIVR